MEEYILTISCPDQTGIVAAVSGFLAQHSGFILDSQQFGDMDTGFFFMREHFKSEEKTMSLEAWRKGFEPIAKRFDMRWELQPQSHRMRALIMASKEGHCLSALLNKKSMGKLQIDVPAIVSNHTGLSRIAESHGTPFHHLEVTPDTKVQQENRILDMVRDLQIDFVVLARYMQILSPNFVDKLEGRIINIHHSFLPSFKGAQPYRQAFEHGVKLIGATAQYVSNELDGGPIIEQDVTRVHHASTVSDLVSLGQDVEIVVLNRAVKWHSQRRVFLNRNKTVVFS